jgi:hypothetical protein
VIYFERTFLTLIIQLQEETGSAEEQPVSNKADTYTVIKEQSAMAALSLLPESQMA